MAEYESTLCWECKNTNRHKCSWFNPADPQPVPGWVAELRPKSMIGESYMVKECPNFDPEPKREAPPPPPGLSVPGVQRRKTKAGVFWVARITRGAKNYHLGTFTSLEKATAARRAAEEAIDRGEEPKRKEAPPRRPPAKKPQAETPPPAKPQAKQAVCGVRRGQRHWTAHIKHEGKTYHLGYFKTEEKAIAARKAAEEAIKRGRDPAH